MFRYIISLIFYPIIWLWNNVIMIEIYGVRPVQIFVIIAFGMALYRFIIIPMSTQYGFGFTVLTTHKSIKADKINIVRSSKATIYDKKLNSYSIVPHSGFNVKEL